MRVLTFTLVGLVFAMLIAGCSQESMMKVFTSPEDEKVAKDYIALLQQKKFDQIENDLDPSVKAKSTDFHKTLLDMAAQIPAQNPVSVKLVGARFFNSNKLHKSEITYEYQYPDQSVLVSIAVQKKDGVSTIIGFNVKKLSDLQESSNKFSLGGKNALQYGVLVAAVIAPLFSLYALVLCIRTKMQGRKWPWIIAILLGVGALSVNWATGEWAFHLVYVQLFSASALAPQYGAWTISVSLPLGAILFLLRRKELGAPVEQTIATDQS